VLDTVFVTVFVTILGASQTAPVAAENPISEAAARGENPIFVVDDLAQSTDSKQPANHEKRTETPTGRPDLLTLKNGSLVEAWDLRIVGDRLECVVKKGNRERALRVPRNQVASVQMQRTIADVHGAEDSERERPPIVTSRRRQPVRHREILAGRFGAQQGRFTDWSFTFTSEINKYYPHAANATEYGTFVLRNRMHQPGNHRSEVKAKGKYFLYAPGVFGDKSWILNLSEVSYTERNISPRRSVYTERLNDEVFVVKMTRDHQVFHLEWANQEGWNWTSPTQQTFYRVLTQEERAQAQARLKALDLRFPYEDANTSLPRLALRD